MAALSSSLAFLLVFPFFLLFSFTSSSNVASEQLKAWSKDVNNKMPNTILSKLSPLSLHDSNYFSSLISKQSFYSHEKFCSVANLACAVDLHLMNSKNLDNGYSSTSDAYNTNYGASNNSFSTAHPSDHINPFSFFRLSILKEGTTIHLSDLRRNTYPSRSFLPSRIASKLSFNLNEIKKMFPESYVSTKTKEAIQKTLFYCNAPTMKGEMKSCPKSLEEMIQFSKNALGEQHMLALTSKSTKGSDTELIIGSVKLYNTKKIVSCHEVFLPYATYFCHSISKSRIYAVDLLDVETRIPINTVLAICHMDTSEWPADHVAFTILKVSPGETEACHWFSQIDLAWIGA